MRRKKIEGDFEKKEEFNAIKKELYEILEKINEYKGKLSESSENLYNCLCLNEKAEELFKKIYPYAMIEYHTDISNEDSINLSQTIEDIEKDFNMSVAYINPEIIEMGRERFKLFLKENSKLNKYKTEIQGILRKKRKKNTTSQEESTKKEMIEGTNSDAAIEEDIEDIKDKDTVVLEDSEPNTIDEDVDEKVEETDERKIENETEEQSETIFSKRIEIPLAGLILAVLIFIIIIISLIIFKDKIFAINSNKLKDSNVYSNQLSGDNLLNEEEKIGFDIVSKWLENYKNTSLEITSKIISYNINSISLNSKKDDKFIILATYDVVPASIDNTIWINDNGEKQGDTIKNKLQYFTIEKINDKYEMTYASVTKPDINENNLTEEKAILLIKNDFSDSDRLILNNDSSMIDTLTEDKKTNLASTLGSQIDDYFKITGTYRNTYILGTFLVNKNSQDKWFVDIEGEAFKLEKATKILNIAEFEVQGDLTMTQDQAVLVTLGSFPKNKRQNVQIAEDWIGEIENKEKVENKLGNLDDYYALKTNSSKGFILIKKNGLAKEFVNKDGKVTDLLGVDDITTVIE